MKQTLLVLLVASLLMVLMSGCTASQLSEAEATHVQPSCPVTAAPQQPFVPPPPWPAEPPDPDRFWYGDAGLWVALPAAGHWAQLACGEKFWLWSAEFDVHEDETPDFVVQATRLDGISAPFRSGRTTNGYHSNFHWAMLTGVELAAPGCWAFNATYKGHELEFVVAVPEA